MKGTKKKKKSTSFHQYSLNSEVETMRISLISWHHKTSNKYLYNQKVPTLCCKSIDSPNFLLEIRVIIEIGSFHDTSLSGWNKKIILNSWNENKWIQQCNFFQIHQFSTFHFEKILELAMDVRELPQN